jgi:hypothetical protein
VCPACVLACACPRDLSLVCRADNFSWTTTNSPPQRVVTPPRKEGLTPLTLPVCVTGVLHGRKRWYVEWWLSDLHGLCTRFLSRSPEYQHNTCMILQSNDDTLVFRRKVLGGEFSGLHRLQARQVPGDCRC